MLLCQRGVTLPVFLSAVWLQKQDADVPDASAGWFHPNQACGSGGFHGPSLPAAADCRKAHVALPLRPNDTLIGNQNGTQRSHPVTAS